jgi:XTP/dITP diphosphohydrolase
LLDKLVLATQNLDKIKEITEILSDLPFQIITFHTVENPWPDIEETGSTLEENAILKAIFVAGWTKLPALADDTGLEVDALNGEPGVYSSRYAGLNVTYEDNRQKLLATMLDEVNRTCTFRTVVALAFPNGENHTVEGTLEGEITQEERGNMGFGYDAIFMVPHLNKTLAELPLKDKNNISHRGRAFRNCKELLFNLINK